MREWYGCCQFIVISRFSFQSRGHNDRSGNAPSLGRANWELNYGRLDANSAPLSVDWTLTARICQFLIAPSNHSQYFSPPNSASSLCPAFGTINNSPLFAA